MTSVDQLSFNADHFPNLMILPPGPPILDPQSGAWLACSYADVQRVLQEHATFSNERASLTPVDSEAGNSTGVMIAMDPPQHARYRGLLAQAFTPQMIGRLEPRIREIASELLDAVQEQDQIDIIDDFAAPLAIIIIAELLGVPAERTMFRQWTDAFFDLASPESGKALQAMSMYFAEVVQQRRQNLQDDLISAMIQAQADNETLTDQEIIAHCGLILFAGNDTTRNLIGNTILCCDAFPGTFEQLKADPSRIPAALEEVLRYVPASLTAPRVAKVDTVLGGQTIQAGQWVLPMLAAANRDPACFAEPDRFDIGRTPNRHLSFGYGIHFCLGAPLARLEARIAIETLTQRFQTLQVLRDGPLETVQSPILYGVKRLPVRVG